MSTQRTVSFHTLGCKLNYSETSTLQRQFVAEGYAVVPFSNPADISIINTCSVTDFANKKCRKAVRSAKRKSPSGKVIVVGCYAQLKPNEIRKMEGVDLVLGAGEKFNIIKHVHTLSEHPDRGLSADIDINQVNAFIPSWSQGDRTRTFLKIQDGCNYTCSFCTIPLARGKSRSARIADVVSQTERLALEGTKEIVLTGVNVGDFGLHPDEQGKMGRKETLIQLLHQLDEINGIERFRISSIEPNLLTDEIIEFVFESKKFMPHFHIPLQSGSPELLKLMRRRYKVEDYEATVRKIKSLMPHACIGVDVIVGFPGESEDHFLETYNFLESIPISYLHVFTYSERENTSAMEMESVVPIEIRRQRNERLTKLSQQKKKKHYLQFLDTARPVLFETHQQKGNISGYTDNYIRILHPLNETNDIRVNSISQVRLKNLAKSDSNYMEITIDSVTTD